MKTNKRRSFTRINKYQKKIILLPLFSTVILCTILTVIIIFVQHNILKTIFQSNGTKTIELINKWSILFISYLWIFFMIIVFNTFTLASNLVGAFTRIIGELDLVILGQKKTSILGRKDEELTCELLDRINKLIEKSNK